MPRLLLAGALCALGSLGIANASALAASTHPYDAAFASTFSVGPACSPNDVATDAAGNFYVACGASGGSIRKFSPSGAPLDFTASTPYISGNTIVANPDPGVANSSFGNTPRLDVDSSQAHPGFIYVIPRSCIPGCGGGTPHLEIFDPSGKWLGSIPTPRNSGFLADVSVDDQGNVYEALESNSVGHVEKYDTLFHSDSRLVGPYYAESNLVAPDTTGGVWIRRPNPVTGSQNPPSPGLYYFESDQFTNDAPGFQARSLWTGALPAPFANPFLTSGIADIAVDLRNDDLYLNRGDRIEPYSHGTADEPPYQNGPTFGSGVLTSSNALAVDPLGNVYATSSPDTIVKFDVGGVLPAIHTNAPLQADIGHTTARLRGHIDKAGAGAITDCQLQWGTTTSYSSTPVPCAVDSSNADSEEVHADISGLAIGTTYHFRFVASNANGQNAGADRTVSPAAVIQLDTGAATAIATHSATLNGSFDPDNYSTDYYFEYGLGTTYGQKTAVASAGPAVGVTPVSVPVSSLQSGKTYHYRIVASNSLGTTYGPDQTFRTASPPEIFGVTAENVAATSADLSAKVNPVGYETTYHFEYGTTTNYGTDIPLADTPIGDGTSAQDVTAHLDDLQPGVVYHFRIVATNQWGSSASDDTTFNFFPPPCPNAHIRQVTGAGYLPDCRAYELVSPPDAGGVSIFPSDETTIFTLSQSFHLSRWPQNTGLATNPPRFSYFGAVGALPGTNPPNAILDQYVATRTDQGWETTFPGLPGDQAVITGRPACSASLDKCLDHEAYGVIAETGPSVEAPYLFHVSGKPLGRLPTNVDSVSGGETFNGDQHPSDDFTHFAFSANNVAFAPGGLTEAPGSVYDNDAGAGTVTIVSKLPGGGDIPRDAGSPAEYIEVPAVSNDGSHILMSTVAPGGHVHLYMSINDAAAIDVSRGAGVDFVAMTRDGSEVVFTTSAPLLPGQDHDTSVDLYRWSEAGDTLTLLSQGNGNGDTDACNASWTTQCDVQPLTPERAHLPTFPGVSSIPGLDDLIAPGSGDAYFYSPEDLDASDPGAPSQRNLYLYRGGEIHFVATFDPGTQVNRMQISPDGRFAALLTASRLTGYDNDGFREMFTYDADTGVIRCASCDPSGAPPTADVTASQGGPFMSNDGRAFFATPDPLVAKDTDGLVSVYEFVEGRPQLISSGTSTRDEAGASVATIFYPTQKIGLESVSADGADVYFTTFDTLVAQDHNGPFVKVYNARTNGGFEASVDLHPCVAADECHGPGNPAPALPTVSTGQSLGSTGNVRTRRHRKKRWRHRKHRKQRRRHLAQAKKVGHRG